MSAERSEPNTPDAASRSASGYRVELPAFEGPLDLLLHLIQAHELDIMDIPIGFVTHKYVEYVTLMHELNIDVASEYLVMAATLAHIKSRMLLPTPPEDQEEEAELEIDPRADLVVGRDVFVRGIPAPEVEGPQPIAPVSLFKLLDAFQTVLARAKTTVDHQIDFERFSITDRINELADILRAKKRLVFEELFAGQESRAEVIVTFLALLEMTRLRMTRLLQAAPLDAIYIELTVADDEVDSLAAEVVAAVGDARAPDPDARGALDEPAAELDQRTRQ
jgi:segregation and condensation protein A